MDMHTGKLLGNLPCERVHALLAAQTIEVVLVHLGRPIYRCFANLPFSELNYDELCSVSLNLCSCRRCARRVALLCLVALPPLACPSAAPPCGVWCRLLVGGVCWWRWAVVASGC